MTKYFISYKFTGVPIEQLHQEIDPLVATFKEAGQEVFCNLYSDSEYKTKGFGVSEIMGHCFEEIQKSDVLVIYVSDGSSGFSGGSAIECGYAIAKGLEIISLLPIDAPEPFSSLRGVSDKIIEYRNQTDLLDQVKTLYNRV